MSRTFSAATAILLLATFLGLSQTEVGLRISFTGGFTNSVPSELYFWLGVAMLLVPAGLCFGWALAGRVTPLTERVVRRLAEAPPRELAAGGLWVFLLYTLAAVLLNQFVLLGFPITDDEQFIRYGGQLLASGRVSEPAPAYLPLMSTWLLYLRDGALTSFDWLGGQLAWAVAELTGTDTAVFAVCAGFFAVGTAAAVGARYGRAWALVALVLVCTSPMAVLLSGTSHAHVVSRGLLALSFAGVVLGEGRGTRWWIATGFVTSAAFITRPPEVALLWLPLGLSMVWDARHGGEERRRLLAFVAGFVPLCLAFVAHSYAVTGTPLPARLTHNELGALHESFQAPLAFFSAPSLLWTRFGANSSYNLFMLTISFWSVLGLPLVLAGVTVDRFTKLLAAGVLLDLCLGLLHDHYGLHLVGPIHYSEAAVPLTVLAVAGLRRLYGAFPDHDTLRRELLVALLVGSTMTFGIANAWYLSALRRQAEIHATIYGVFDDPKFDDAIVLGPGYSDIWRANPGFRRTQTFVYRWRPMDPAREDRVLFAHFKRDDRAALDALRAAFPARTVYIVGTLSEPPWIQTARLDDVLSGGP